MQLQQVPTASRRNARVLSIRTMRKIDRRGGSRDIVPQDRRLLGRCEIRGERADILGSQIGQRWVASYGRKVEPRPTFRFCILFQNISQKRQYLRIRELALRHDSFIAELCTFSTTHLNSSFYSPTSTPHLPRQPLNQHISNSSMSHIIRMTRPSPPHTPHRKPLDPRLLAPQSMINTSSRNI